MSTGTSIDAVSATLNRHASAALQRSSGNGNVGSNFHRRSHLRHGLSSGRLPDGCGYIQRYTDDLRRALENAVMARSGDEVVTVTEAAHIQSAVRWERHSLLAQRWLRMKESELSNAELLAFSREVAKASSGRDRSIVALNLDSPVDDFLDGLCVPAVTDELQICDDCDQNG